MAGACVVDCGVGDINFLLNMFRKVAATVFAASCLNVAARADRLILPEVGSCSTGANLGGGRRRVCQ